MTAEKITYSSGADDDDPCIIAAQLFESQGYRAAQSRVSDYIDAAENDLQRAEWRRIASELDRLCTIENETGY